jgi:hypothetical protein
LTVLFLSRMELWGTGRSSVRISVHQYELPGNRIPGPTVLALPLFGFQ